MADYNGGTVRWVIDASTDGFDEKMNFVQAKAQETASSLNSFGRSFTNIFTNTLTAGATGATAALTALVKKGIQATDFLETARVSMSGLTGSVEEGNKAMTLAAKYWQNNPFQRIDVTNATQQLIQFGRNTSQISSDLETLGNVSLSTGMNISELARYYARVSASGRAMTMDLEMMSDRGVPIYRELEKQLNTTTAGVRKLASEGKISFEDFRKAMEGAINAEAMEEYENTMARQTDRLKGSIQILAGQLAGYKIINDELVISENGLEKAWTRLLKTLATELRSDKMKDAMEKIGTALAKVVDKITELIPLVMDKLGTAISFISEHSSTLLPIFGAALVFVGKLGSRLPVIGGLISGLGNNVKGLASSLFQLAKAKPGLTSILAVFGYGFVQALKNSEEFRQTMSDLFKSLSEIAVLIGNSIKPVIEALVSAFTELATSDVVQGILQGLASALLGIANALKSIPTPVLTALVTALITMKMLSVSPFMGIVTAITLVVGAFQQLAKKTEILKDLPQKFMTAAHNMIIGLVNGLAEGAKKVIAFIGQLANNIVKTFSKVLGIHSPSRVMYYLGMYTGLGLAEGITDSSSAVQKAMDNLASDILTTSETIIQNQVDFNIIDANGMYKAWKKVSKLFVQGSSQYAAALDKMEDARKSVNQKILSLQQEYNNALDSTINRISTMYNLFDEVELKSGKNASKLIKNLDQQVAKMQQWASAQEIISGLGIDQGLINELKNMGVDAVDELSAIANMTSDELDLYNNLWLQKQEIANTAGVKQMEDMKNDTLAQIEALKDGIDGETIDVQEVGGRLVANIAEGVYGALPTLEDAFDKLDDYIVDAAKSLKSASNEVADSITGGSDDYSIPEAGNQITEQMSDLSDTIKNAGNDLVGILAGVVGGIVAFKFGPSILKWVGGKLFGGLQGGVLGNLLNSKIGEVAKDATSAIKPAKEIAESTTQISKSVQTTSKGFSKADSLMDSIQKGAKTIILIAAAIAAVAAACWFTYNAMKDIEWDKFAIALVEMVAAVAVFGLLAKAAEIIKVSAKSILLIIGIAVDIAAVALACRIAYELMKDIPWDGFASVLGQMAAAIGTFGVLNGILGIKVVALAEGLGLLVSAGIIVEIIALSKACREAYDTMKDMSWENFGNMLGMMASALGVMGALNAPLGLLMPLAALGWASIMMICDEMVKLSKALVVVDENVPEDFDSLEEKLKNIKKTLEIINGLDLGTVIGMMVTSWSAGPVERIMDMYVHVAEQLNKLSKIELDKEAIENNLDYIKATLESIKAKNDVISGWLEASAMDMEASTVENAGRIVIVYGDMVDALDKLADFTPDEGAITTSLTKMVGVITILRNSSYGGGGIFHIFDSMETVANDVEKIKSIVKNYLEMVPTIQDLGKSENQISESLKTTVTDNINRIKAIVTTIGSVDTGGWIDQKESDMSKIQSILNKYTELEPVIWQISQFNLSYLEGDNSAKKKIEKIREIVLEIGRVDTGGWIDQKESDMAKIQSILNKYTEIAQTCGLLSKYPVPENAQGWIQTVRHLVWEIGQVNQSESNSLDAKAEIIEKSKNIAIKLQDFASVLKDLEAPDKGGVIQSLTDSLYQLVSGVATSLSSQTSAFENVGSEFGQSLASGIQSQNDNVANAGNGLQSSLWWALENKMGDEYSQGEWMATQFGNGLESVSFDSIGAAMQTSLWWGIQNRMQDEYYQGQAMGQRFRQGLYDVDYGNAGWWAVQGFINGAWGRAGAYDGMYNTGRWVTERFLQGIKDRGKQGSPWKTTMESGNWAIEGLIDGIKDSEGALVKEANTLADEVVDALTIDDISISPDLDANLSGTPTMTVGGGYSAYRNGNGVIIEQTNNNYTEYDIDRVNRDLTWRLAKA